MHCLNAYHIYTHICAYITALLLWHINKNIYSTDALLEIETQQLIKANATMPEREADAAGAASGGLAAGAETLDTAWLKTSLDRSGRRSCSPGSSPHPAKTGTSGLA